MPPVYDQLKLGACTANALVACYECLTPNFMGSRLFLYYNERLIENTIAQDCGTQIFDGVKALETYGVCLESEYPYVVSRFSVQPPQKCYTNALRHKVLKALNVRADLTSLKTCLAAGYPMVVGIEIYTSFETELVAKTGFVTMPCPKDSLLGGHAVCIVGYDDSRQIFIMRNSWGSSWGDNGHFYLPYVYLTNPTLTSDIWTLISDTN